MLIDLEMKQLNIYEWVIDSFIQIDLKNNLMKYWFF